MSGRVFAALLITVLAAGLAYTLPADLALLAAIDYAVWVDAMVGVFVFAQVSRIRPIMSLARLKMMALIHRIRGRTEVRPSPRRDDKAGSNDDYPDPASARMVWAA